MNVQLWSGFHSRELPGLISQAWEQNRLLILCPPGLKDFGFLKHLPASSLNTVGIWDAESLELIQHAANLPKVAPPPWSAKPVLGVFTTGTVSGIPRLILYSKANIEASLQGIRSFFDTSRIETIFCYPQPFHTFGLILGYVQAMLYRLELVVEPGRYSRPAHLLRTSQKNGNLLTLGTPTHFHDLAEYLRVERTQLGPSYTSISGGAKTSVALWKSMRDDLKIEMPSVGYGATEAAPGITHLPPGQMPLEDGEIGTPLPGIELTLKPGLGLEFTGPNSCLCIIQGEKVELPREILIRDHVERRPQDGMLLFKGRYELLLNRGGSKFSLERIQESIQKKFGIETVCLAVSDPRLGEELGVLAKLPEGARLERLEIYQLLKDELNTSFNPQYFVQTPEIPLNQNGKVDRGACTRIIEERSLEQWADHGGEFAYPLSVDRLKHWLPHRAPAIWVDEVSWITQDEGECLIRFNPAAHYATHGKLRQSSLIEWMAQSYGYVMTCQMLSKRTQAIKKPARAYLVAVTRLTWSQTPGVESIQAGESLRIRVRKTHQMGPLALVEGSVLTANDHVLAKAQIKLFAE